MKHDNIKNKLGNLSIGNGPVQWVKVEKFIRDELFKRVLAG